MLDPKHRVRGTTGLRVVDASAFREIPGSFIWAPVAQLSERAAQEILKDAWPDPAPSRLPAPGPVSAPGQALVRSRTGQAPGPPSQVP